MISASLPTVLVLPLRTWWLGLALPFAALFVPGWAVAQESAAPSSPNSYALVVANSHGGPGQNALKYAERDAQKMALVLVELARLPSGNVSLLTGASVATVRSELRQIERKLLAHKLRGEPSTLVFYYSGHAKANALSLGSDELPLSELRDRVLSMPASLKIIVLDACQSGAITRAKGIRSAEDFSINSIRHFNAEGSVIIASSSESELSQESDHLHASYFTHHFTTALRGAGDSNHDGRVTLSEAYNYAHGKTLTDTKKTRVGAQHVTLETNLRGQDDLGLSYLADARRRLELPARLAGSVLIGSRDGTTVVSEIDKVPGQRMTLAIPGAAEVAIVNRGGSAERCQITRALGARDRAFILSDCEALPPDESTAKGSGHDPYRPFGVALSVGLIRPIDDAYVSKLQNTFDYSADIFDLGSATTYGAMGSYSIDADWQLIMAFRELDQRHLHDDETGLEFSWDTWSLAAGGRYTPKLLGIVRGVAGLDLGAAYSRTKLVNTAADGFSDSESYLGFVATGTLGFELRFKKPFIVDLAASYAFAPVIENEIGQTHNSGGLQVLTSVGYAFGEER